MFQLCQVPLPCACSPGDRTVGSSHRSGERAAAQDCVARASNNKVRVACYALSLSGAAAGRRKVLRRQCRAFAGAVLGPESDLWVEVLESSHSSADTSLGWVPSPERAAVRDLRDAVAAAVAPEPWWPTSPAHVGSRSAADVGDGEGCSMWLCRLPGRVDGW